jgi:hypothetical protein
MLLALEVDVKPRVVRAKKKADLAKKRPAPKTAPERRFFHATDSNACVRGFLLCMASLENMYSDLCEGDAPPMDFISSYRTSQDHLESFFACVRAAGGWNVNPTPHLFKYLLRRCMLIRLRDVTGGNCVLQVKNTIEYQFKLES